MKTPTEPLLCRILAGSLKRWDGGDFLRKGDTLSAAKGGGEMARRIEAGPEKTEGPPGMPETG